jgi:hypothetical protein
VPASAYLRTIIIDVIAEEAELEKISPMIAAQQAKLYSVCDRDTCLFAILL